MTKKLKINTHAIKIGKNPSTFDVLENDNKIIYPKSEGTAFGPLSVVVKDTAIGAEGLGFDSRLSVANDSLPL